ncbi:hypothetical protein KQX54_018368 [Cotesia glomerata]|uniref:Uncharacterized protein n=1 Tax=Cotesia glomerata TaxID=32391 RepID=A0AAV7HYW5_COTGL|nr:hypothetical protein KQX54_018368 [Cotesia glomerata]
MEENEKEESCTRAGLSLVEKNPRQQRNLDEKEKGIRRAASEAEKKWPDKGRLARIHQPAAIDIEVHQRRTRFHEPAMQDDSKDADKPAKGFAGTLVREAHVNPGGGCLLIELPQNNVKIPISYLLSGKT